MNFIPEEHYRNRSQFPAEELAKFYGQEVAWTQDGRRIVASGQDPQEVCAAVRKAGLQTDEVVLAYIPYPEEAVLGSAFQADMGDRE